MLRTCCCNSSSSFIITTTTRERVRLVSRPSYKFATEEGSKTHTERDTHTHKTSSAVNLALLLAKPQPPEIALLISLQSTNSNRLAGIHGIYKIMHLFLLLLVFFCINAQRVACSNTSRTPSLVLAEHSRYRSALTTFLTASPCGLLIDIVSQILNKCILTKKKKAKGTSASVTGFCDVLASSWMVFWSCRKSFLHPTRMIGRPWQK
jgi:hypothetical protein